MYVLYENVLNDFNVDSTMSCYIFYLFEFSIFIINIKLRKFFKRRVVLDDTIKAMKLCHQGPYLK